MCVVNLFRCRGDRFRPSGSALPYPIACISARHTVAGDSCKDGSSAIYSPHKQRNLQIRCLLTQSRVHRKQSGTDDPHSGQTEVQRRPEAAEAVADAALEVDRGGLRKIFGGAADLGDGVSPAR